MKNKRPLVMGILNVTPDSFSDGGQHNAPHLALNHALQMIEEGADIIDVGGESTRPGANVVSEEEQISRVIPVIEYLRKNIDDTILISIDTTNAKVAKLAIEAGANWINDVSAGEDSDNMLALAASKQVPIILMHRQGISATMQDNPRYKNVVDEVTNYLQQRATAATSAGVKPSNIILDPGIGFGKSFEHNLTLMSQLTSITALGYEVLLGTSRKRFLSEICKQKSSSKLAAATAATTTLGVMADVSVFRVHDVFENRQAVDVAWEIKSSSFYC